MSLLIEVKDNDKQQYQMTLENGQVQKQKS